MFHGRISLNVVLLLRLVNFLSRFRLQLMYISLIVSIRSSLTHWLGFRLLVLLPLFIEITLYQQNKSSDSKTKFRQASNFSKRVLEAAKLAYANKTKKSIILPKLGSGEFCRIANIVFNKGNSAIPSLFSDP